MPFRILGFRHFGLSARGPLPSRKQAAAERFLKVEKAGRFQYNKCKLKYRRIIFARKIPEMDDRSTVHSGHIDSRSMVGYSCAQVQDGRSSAGRGAGTGRTGTNVF